MAAQPIALGIRGAHFRQLNDKVDLRMYNRGIENPEVLVPTPRGIELDGKEWAQLMSHGEDITTAAKQAENGADPTLFLPIGHDGIHVAVNKYENHVLVQIRQFFRPFKQPEKLLPTRTGIALKVAEWEELRKIKVSPRV